MSAAVSFWTTGTSKLSSADILLGLIFALPIATLVLAFGISTHSEQGIAQAVEQVASSQM